MRTENDLRLALLSRADEAPDVSLALIERALNERPQHARTRARLTVAVAVAAVAALIGTPFAIQHRTDNRPVTPATSAPKPPSPTPASVTDLGWITVAAGYQFYQTTLADPAVNYRAEQVPRNNSVGIADVVLTDYPPGGFDPKRIAGAVPVVVDGHAGYFGLVSVLDKALPISVMSSYPHGAPIGQHPSLAWQVATNQWVVLTGVDGITPRSPALSKTALVSIAHTMGIRARTAPSRSMIKIGYLPGTGWQLRVANFGNESEHRASYETLVLTKGSVTIDVGAASPSDALAMPHRTIGSYGVWVEPNHRFGDPGSLDQAELLKIQNSITLAAHPAAEDSSWFPFDQVMP